MLSTTHNFLFVHVPKTGGNAIQDALRQYSEDAIVCLESHHDGVDRFEVRSPKYKTVKHSTLADYQCEYGGQLMTKLFKFSAVRNTWDRCMSHYFSPHRGPVTWKKTDFIRFIELEVNPIRYYLAKDAGTASLRDAVAAIDFLIRYESLQEDFDNVCKQLALPDLHLHFRNVSLEADHRRHYDRDLRSLVAEKFSEEIGYFGYRFE
jgi:hypothetical protein